MAKKSTKKSTKSSTTDWKVIGVVSLLINAVLLVSVVALISEGKKGTFDGYMVDRGLNKLCSKKFRDEMDKSMTKNNSNDNSRQLQMARIDFACGNNDSSQYYDKAFNEYTQSKGIKNNQP